MDRVVHNLKILRRWRSCRLTQMFVRRQIHPPGRGSIDRVIAKKRLERLAPWTGAAAEIFTEISRIYFNQQAATVDDCLRIIIIIMSEDDHQHLPLLLVSFRRNCRPAEMTVGRSVSRWGSSPTRRIFLPTKCAICAMIIWLLSSHHPVWEKARGSAATAAAGWDNNLKFMPFEEIY